MYNSPQAAKYIRKAKDEIGRSAVSGALCLQTAARDLTARAWANFIRHVDTDEFFNLVDTVQVWADKLRTPIDKAEAFLFQLKLADDWKSLKQGLHDTRQDLREEGKKAVDFTINLPFRAWHGIEGASNNLWREVLSSPQDLRLAIISSKSYLAANSAGAKTKEAWNGIGHTWHPVWETWGVITFPIRYIHHNSYKPVYWFNWKFGDSSIFVRDKYGSIEIRPVKTATLGQEQNLLAPPSLPVIQSPDGISALDRIKKPEFNPLAGEAGKHIRPDIR